MKLGEALQLKDKAVIAMVHVRALPGTPCSSLAIDQIAEQAVTEAKTLADAGFDALIVENMHDRPYLLRDVGPEITASMTRVAVEIRRAIGLPLGVQILAGANNAAMAVAKASGAQFIRAEGFVFAHVADEGIMTEAAAAQLLRYRKQIGAEDIAVIADIKKKHSSHAITADVDLEETANAAAFFGADGVIVTGSATAQAATVADVSCAAKSGLPVIVGSGLSPANLADYWPHADAFIVGSALKHDGEWSNSLDSERITAFMDKTRDLREA
ncbi:MAG: hypothetical protein DHS20C16_13640 [Phycisphaerae bacterium]|nr:MAG: hypothetical protein DHS20C16_13640 [Phycisphaerae bacterium]